MKEFSPYLPGLSPVGGKEIHARFDGGRLSSDGGVLVLREIERDLGLADLLASHLPDTRDPGSVIHGFDDMIRARMFAIACGYEDCDDLDALRVDPAFKLACGRLSETGRDLMSQPTLSRLENAPTWRQLARMGLSMIDLFCETSPAFPNTSRSTSTTPAMRFTAANSWPCSTAITMITASSRSISMTPPPESRSCPCCGPASGFGAEAATVLRHVVTRILNNWPRVHITVRGDGHYGTPEVMDWLESRGCGYIFGLSSNGRLKEIGQPWGEDVAVRRATSGKEKIRRFFQTAYAAKSWKRERTVIARVEATAKGSDIRFIVTNLAGRAKTLYEKVYCARGKMENMIKEHKLYTKSDRTSCHRWEANQFRLFLHTGAYWLLLKLRNAAPRKSIWKNATFETLRRSFLKIAVRIEELKSRITVALPTAYPYKTPLIAMAGKVASQGP
ncbi:protein of unknown function [Magnetospira sp. QH-2]|nr:protein of unknown function [Magnetospira sp. QH-2]